MEAEINHERNPDLVFETPVKHEVGEDEERGPFKSDVERVTQGQKGYGIIS